jgi:hypothetical protein
MAKIPLVSAVINGLVKLVKALNCKCKSSCCQSECSQGPKSPKRSDPDIKEHAVQVGELKKITQL